MTAKPVSGPGLLDRDQVWSAIDRHRTSLCDLLDDLSGDDWQQPSLCAGWTVREVAAHLTQQQAGPAEAATIVFSWHIQELSAAVWALGPVPARTL